MTTAAALALLCLLMLGVRPAAAATPGRWIAGDLHTHTVLTDGSVTQTAVAAHAFGDYRLGWFANSEHGGRFGRDADGDPFVTPVFRWITLRDESFPAVAAVRAVWPSRLLVQGVEWNAPTLDHVSVGIVADEPTSISDFEYSFDANDTDTSRAGEGIVKASSSHVDAIAAVRWLGARYPRTSYAVVNHPSIRLRWRASDLRALSDAAPAVAFGFEGIPGHQKRAARGGYAGVFGGDATAAARARTYGGADPILARVGGVWDSLLSEGRHYWVFADSDFHSTAGDFWPGEYAKTYTWVRAPGYPALAQGLRSGRSFAVTGGLVDRLQASVRTRRRAATFGQTLWARRGEAFSLIVRFRSPATNASGRRVRVDHVDVIVGRLRTRAASGTAAYSRYGESSTRVVRRIDARSFAATVGGWRQAKVRLTLPPAGAYIRLRGTNLRPGTPRETDARGSPLMDDLAGPNTATKAWRDTWFYSNPVFVRFL